MNLPIFAVTAGLLLASGSAVANDRWQSWDRDHHERRGGWHDNHRHDRHCDHRDGRGKHVVYGAPVVVYQTPPQVVYRERVVYRDVPVHRGYERSYAPRPSYDRPHATYSTGNDRVVGQVLGAVAGGVLGNQIGGGNGRVVATTVGAVIGSAIGGEMASR